jgi:drug/metabolite transporter (DMT)-like permease
MNSRQFAVLLLLAALWGASFLLIKIGVAEIAPELLVAARLTLSALVLLLVLYAGGQRLPTRPRVWRDLFLLGVLGLVLPYLLITWAEQFMASGMAAILNATTPLFAVLLTFLWTREERLSGLRLLGVALGFVGVVVAVGVSELAIGDASRTLLPQLAVLLAAFCYAGAGIYGRSAFRGVPALVPATGQLLAGAIVITPIALALRGLPAELPSAGAIGAVLLLAVFGTAAAYVLLYWLMERIGATRTSMVTYLLPPFALVYGAIFLREPITANALLGLLLVVLGILLASGKLRPAPASAKPRAASGGD